MKLNKLAMAVMGILGVSSAQAFEVTFNTESSETTLTISWDESFDEAVTLYYANSPENIASGTSISVEQGVSSVTLENLDYDLTYYFRLSRVEDEQEVFSEQTGVGFVPVFAYPLIEVIQDPNELIGTELSTHSVISNDGRYIYNQYEVDSSLTNDNNIRDEFFVYDRKLRKSTPLSFRDDTVLGSGFYRIVDVDNDGNGYFSTRNANLVEEPDVTSFRTLYRYSPETESLSLLLKEDSGNRLTGNLEYFDVSSDGNTVVFVIDDVDELPGYPDFDSDFFGDHAFIYDVAEDTYTHISDFGDIGSLRIDLVKASPDGRYVALRTDDDDILQSLVPSDSRYINDFPIIFDTQTGERRVPTTAFLEDGSSTADNVQAFDLTNDGDMLFGNQNSLLYRYDWSDDAITLLSDRNELRHNSQIFAGFRMDASDDGNHLVFSTASANIEPQPPAEQVQVYDVEDDEVSAVSLDALGEYSERAADTPSISNNGDYVTFNTNASNLDSEKRDGYGFFATFADRTDSDADGYVDTIDQVPNDAGDWLDSDGDGIGNHLEDDSDNDGVSDAQEEIWGLNPINAADGAHDVDGDTLTAAQEAELGTSIFLVDTDADGYNDNEDAFPTDETEWLDTDGDGIGNNADEDDDNDGFNDEDDAFPLDETEWLDTDGDGIGNNADEDDDNDGFNDEEDAFPLDETEWLDTDGDGIGNNADEDDDNDGVPDEEDAFPLDENESKDSDGDGIGDNSDPDVDGDGIANIIDCSPADAADATRCLKVQFDFDGDGSADIAVRRPSNFIQYIKNSGDDEIQRVRFGFNSTDIPVSGDFDGDGIADVAVRRPSNQFWYINNSSGVDLISGNEDGITRIRFGLNSADIPVPADYDGDGITDIAVRRPSSQSWFIRNSSGVDEISNNADGITRSRFGRNSADIPVVADYDGDGKADLAVRRPSNQFWYIRNSTGVDNISNKEDGITRMRFGGQEADIPVPADYDGDGLADLAVRRPSNHTWYVLNSSGTTFNSTRNDNIQRVRFGTEAGDILIPADYDGDGITDFAVRNASEETQYILRSSDGETTTLAFGRNPADIPLAAPVATRMEMAADNGNDD